MNPRIKVRREHSPLFDFAEVKQRAEFAHTRTRSTDPVTSRAAAESMSGAAETQRRDLLRALRDHPNGLTCDEADEVLGWRPTTAGRRMHELVAKGIVRSTSQTRETRSGRAAFVYEANV